MLRTQADLVALKLMQIERRSQHKGLAFNLTNEKTKQLLEQVYCFWCGCEFVKHQFPDPPWKKQENRTDQSLTFDRIDPAGGYTIDNVVAACYKCNENRDKAYVKGLKGVNSQMKRRGEGLSPEDVDDVLTRISEIKIQLFRSSGRGALYWVPGKNRFQVVGSAHPSVSQTISYEGEGFDNGFNRAIELFNSLRVEEFIANSNAIKGEEE